MLKDAEGKKGTQKGLLRHFCCCSNSNKRGRKENGGSGGPSSSANEKAESCKRPEYDQQLGFTVGGVASEKASARGKKCRLLLFPHTRFINVVGSFFFYCCCSRPLFGRYCVPGRGEGEGCSFSGFQQDWSVFLQQMLLSGGLGDVEVVYGGEVSVRIRAGRCFFTETLIVIYCERHSYGKITEVINISGFFLEVD